MGTLYKGGDYFGCRDCYDLTYDSRNTSKRFRGTPWRYFDLSMKIEELESKISRHYYAGKPTRKYRRVLRLMNRLNYEDIKTSIDDYLAS